MLLLAHLGPMQVLQPSYPYFCAKGKSRENDSLCSVSAGLSQPHSFIFQDLTDLSTKPYLPPRSLWALVVFGRKDVRRVPLVLRNHCDCITTILDSSLPPPPAVPAV